MTDGQTSISLVDNDVFKLTGVCDTTDDEYVYYEKAITQIPTATTYPYVKIRWKTSNASNALGAKVVAVFTDADTEVILGATAPQFSTTWTTTTYTWTKAKTLDKLRFYADDYPDSITGGGTTYVYYDFVLVYMGTFTFPFVSHKLELDLESRYADLPIPGRWGDVTQWAGTSNPIIRLDGVMDTNANWGTPPGQTLMKEWLKTYTEPWNWFTSDVFTGKVTPRTLRIAQDSTEETKRTWNAEFALYSKSSAGGGNWTDLEFLGF